MMKEEFIRKTFELARKGAPHNWPNPLVGAVIIKNGRIIGEGFHQKYGQDHAEVNALKNCSESPEGATIYVNLEPCSHTNKQTPPCAQRLISEKIKKVVICNVDPNPHVCGNGLELLKANGIEVESGILKEEGEKLNEVYFHTQKNKKPFVHLKIAATLDGMIALPNGESQWITGEASRKMVHEWRSNHQAVVIGAHTLRADNPKLNVRLNEYEGCQPWRILFTKSGQLPQGAQLFNDELKLKTLIYSQGPLKIDFPSENVKKINSLPEALEDLFNRKIVNLLLEGGPNLASAFIKEKLVQRVSIFMNPSFLGSGKSMLTDLGINSLEKRPRLEQMGTQWVGDDLLITGRLN